MKTLQSTLFIVLFLFSIESKCQNYRLDTLTIYFKENNTKFYFPKIRHSNPKIENQINDLINRVIISELNLSDTTITKLYNLPFEKMEGWYGSNFNVLYNRNSIISIDFYFEPKGHPFPLSFIKTFDIQEKKELKIEDIIDSSFKNELFTQIKSKINDEVNGGIELINSDEEFINRKNYLKECYESLRTEQKFQFYIEELNHQIIIKLSRLCIPNVDVFTYDYSFPEIKKYLKEDYKMRIN